MIFKSGSKTIGTCAVRFEFITNAMFAIEEICREHLGKCLA